jgi:hypothetical protein
LPPERVHQLVAELEKLISADLTHPSIAAPVATGISGTSAYLVQDFVAADSLDIVVRDHGPAPAYDALRVATQLGGALDFAATVDVLHGALHPRDVLLSPDDTRVIGHGVTRALERVGVTTSIRRPYTAPERAANGTWDRRADIFSLAALIYEMLSGKRLASSAEQAGEMLAGTPGTDAAALRRVFAQALAEDPAKRFAAALDFAEALKGALTIAALEPERATPAAMPREKKGNEPALPFDDLRPAAADGFDIETVFASVEEPIELHLHEEPVIQLREEIPVADLPVAPMPVRVEPPLVVPEPLPRARPEAPSRGEEPSRGAPVMADAAPKREVRKRQPIAAQGDTEEALPLKEPEPAAQPPKLAPPTAFIDQSTEEFRESALEKTRSAVWPLALAIGVGLVVGFAGGYGVAMRDRLMSPPMPPDNVAPAPIASAAPGAPTPSVVQPAPVSASPVSAAPSMAAQAAPPSALPVMPSAPAASSAPVVPAAAPAPAPANGRLVIRSTPAGARVSVDGHEAGTTPATVRDLARGPHNIRVTQEGYNADERRVVLSEDRMSQAMRFELTRKPVAGAPAQPPAGPGGLMIESRPSGAAVYMDGKPVGTTPMAMESVAAGDHSIGLVSEGYQRWVGSVRVATGERARVTASLER